MINLLNYVDRPSIIHRLTGASKLLCLLLWTAVAMTTFYTPLLAIMAAASILLFRIAKLRFNDVSFMLWATIFFALSNNLLIYLFSPEHGTTLYGTRTLLFPIVGPYTVTAEQLLYHLNLLLKYTASIPIILIFVCTTNPSEFAASLNRIGVSYRVSYAVALALRYIPDVQRDYRDISLAQQARGVEMSKKASLIDRLKSISGILIPLVLSSLERIDMISNAMELRGFGKGKRRSWYAGRSFSKADMVGVMICVMLFAASLTITFINGSKYYNPFIR